MHILPTEHPHITREQAVNHILLSIAMEEYGLSHIINAEGEKIQYVLGTLSGIPGPDASVEDVLKVNESVKNLLAQATDTQQALVEKLKTAVSTPVLRGPTGPTGPTGPSGDSGLLLHALEEDEYNQMSDEDKRNPNYIRVVHPNGFFA